MNFSPMAIFGAAGFALTAAQKLGDKFSSIKISQSELDVAERKIKGELIEKFEERVNNWDRIKALPLRPCHYCGRDVLIEKLEKFTIQNFSF